MTGLVYWSLIRYDTWWRRRHRMGWQALDCLSRIIDGMGMELREVTDDIHNCLRDREIGEIWSLTYEQTHTKHSADSDEYSFSPNNKGGIQCLQSQSISSVMIHSGQDIVDWEHTSFSGINTEVLLWHYINKVERLTWYDARPQSQLSDSWRRKSRKHRRIGDKFMRRQLMSAIRFPVIAWPSA